MNKKNKPDIKLAEEIAKKVIDENSGGSNQNIHQDEKMNLDKTESHQKNTDQTNEEELDLTKLNPAELIAANNNLSKENAEHKDKLIQMKDSLLRAMSELENTRKRLQKEKTEAIKYSSSDIIKDFFTIYDNLSYALSSTSSSKHAEESVSALITGVELTRNEMIAVFSRHNIEIISPARGDEFDYDLHQAGGSISDKDIADGAICKTLAVGIKYHDRLLRPATVLVCNNDETTDTKSNASKNTIKNTSKNASKNTSNRASNTDGKSDGKNDSRRTNIHIDKSV